MVHAELEYSSSGCNRCVGNLVWDIDGVIVFGSHHAVVVYDTTASKVVTTMLGHKDVVTSVAYVPRGVVDNASDEDSHWIVSGSADGCIVVWELCLSEARRRQQEVAQGPMWRVFQMMEGHHQGPLTWVSVETYRKQEDGSTSCVMVSSAGDGDLVVCQFVEGRFVEVQRLSFGTKLVHCAAVGFLEVHSTLLLGLGFIDGAVKLYVSGAGQNVSFSLACNLTGHQNWIRGIDFINVANDKMILATGSQDRYIRLWSIEPRRDAEGIAGHDLAPSLDALGITKYAPKPRIKLGDALYTVLLESLLVGHEDWVMNVSWNKSNAVEPMLLSSSMDRTMVVWKKDVDSGALFLMALFTALFEAPHHLLL
jgi:elongator complex protein 2